MASDFEEFEPLEPQVVETSIDTTGDSWLISGTVEFTVMAYKEEEEPQATIKYKGSTLEHRREGTPFSIRVPFSRVETKSQAMFEAAVIIKSIISRLEIAADKAKISYDQQQQDQCLGEGGGDGLAS